jgi:hypothetical protein
MAREMRALIIAALLVAGPAGAQDKPASVPSLLGVTVPPLPKGCKSLASGLIGKDEKNNELAMYHLACGRRHVLLITEFLEYDYKQKSQVWKVVEEARLPLLRKGQQIWNLDCETPLVKDVWIAAIGTVTNDKGVFRLSNISGAWYLDAKNAKIRQTDSAQVTCYIDDDRD